MAVIPVGLDRLKSQLLTSGLSQKDPVLYQVINQLIDYLRQSNLALTDQISNSGTGTAGITQLTGDVLAGPGSGIVSALINTNAVTTIKILDSNVTYAKIQNVTAERLLGRDNSGDGIVQELTVGSGLLIENGELNIINGSGGTGLLHNLLSLTHPDTIPAEPTKGDLIYAGDAINPEGTFINAVLVGTLVEDFVGIRAAYMLGFNGQELPPGNVGWGAPPPLNYIIPEPADQWLTWDFIDAFLQGTVIDDFIGIRAAYIAGDFGPGIGWAYTSYPVNIIPTPNPETEIAEGQWQRLPKGNEGELLGILDGIPAWLEDVNLPGELNVQGSVIALDVHGTNSVTSDGNIEGAEGIFSAQITTPSIELAGNTIGIWNNVPYNAGDFTALGGVNPSWDVASGDVVCFRWTRILNIAIIQVFIVSSTVASDSGDVTELRIKIPAAMQSVGSPAFVVGAQEAGVATNDIYCTTESSDDTLIFLRKYPVGAGAAFDQTVNGTFTGFTAIIEVL